MSLNAFKTGTYARTAVLPWEDPEAYEQLRAEIFADMRPLGRLEEGVVDDMAQNRWLHERQRQSTAIATHRHAFGKKLEDSNVKSWRDALTFVRELDNARRQVFGRIDATICKVAEAVGQLTKRSDAVKPQDEIEKLIDIFSKIYARLASLDKRNDESEFLLQYSSKLLERRVKAENSLDAQFDKLRARLVLLQEARIRRGELEIDATTDALARGIAPDAARATVKQANAPMRSSKSPRPKDAAQALDGDDPLAAFVEGLPIDEEDLGCDDVDPVSPHNQRIGSQNDRG